MKLHILSDLHTEFADFQPPKTQAAVVILAGDIGVGLAGAKWAGARFPDVPVVYVPGNHEYYHHDIALLDNLRNCASPNIHVLNDQQLVLGNVRFLCCTLWTDFELFGQTNSYFSIQRAKQFMNDFSCIEKNGKRFTPEDSIALHAASRAWLTAKLAESFAGTTVVVSHHLPSSKSVAVRYASNLLTPAFASDLNGLMAGDRVALWIHGHTHDAFDYEINGTRVVCNPRGYPGEKKDGSFQPDLVVTV